MKLKISDIEKRRLKNRELSELRLVNKNKKNFFIFLLEQRNKRLQLKLDEKRKKEEAIRKAKDEQFILTILGIIILSIIFIFIFVTN